VHCQLSAAQGGYYGGSGAKRESGYLGSIILDWLLHHSHVITFRGCSYRLWDKRKAWLIKLDGIHHPEQVARG
jgi:hypothetical protein